MMRFRCGLVVGKFSPLHRGHEAVIRCALNSCDEVIIISYSKPEHYGCEALRRAQWLAEIFPSARRLVLTDEYLREHGKVGDEFSRLPDNDAPDVVHRDFCAFLCKAHLGATVDAVFTSEEYGFGFAEHLTRRFRSRPGVALPVQHVCVDLNRTSLPISGSLIRSDVHANRHWLSPCVYASFVQRICIVGGESSGKSTLARALAQHFATEFVPEYGRELWVKKAGQLEYEDMLDIASRQIEREQAAALRSDRYLFCDTSALTTLFYSIEMFGRAEPTLQTMALRTYDCNVLCSPDFEFVQDGTRRDDGFRQRQHAWYLEQFRLGGQPYLLAEGSIQERVDRTAAYLERRCR